MKKKNILTDTSAITAQPPPPVIKTDILRIPKWSETYDKKICLQKVWFGEWSKDSTHTVLLEGFG